MGKPKHIERYYKTVDMGLAAFLKLAGYEMLEMEPVKGKQGRFQFVFRSDCDASADCNSPVLSTKEAAYAYYNRRRLVDARSFFDELALLKSMTAEEQRRRGAV